MQNFNRSIIKKYAPLALVLIVIAGAIFYLEMQKPERSTVAGTDITQTAIGAEGGRLQSIEEKTAQYPRAKELEGIEGYINTEPIELAEYVGEKVILLDFWTYSCINCQRTQPYLNEWYEKYKDKGLVIVGVHTPEFEFEKDYDNVVRAVAEDDIKYPVVLDNSYSTWSAYRNRFWPRRYIIDIDGYVVYDHIGEGAYEETEEQIQKLLKERAAVLGESIAVNDALAQPQSSDARPGSPETYFGSSRNEFLGNGTPGRSGTQTFTQVSRPSLNTLYLTGAWNVRPEYAESSAGSGITFRYAAQQVYFVAGAPGESIEVEVLLDDNPIPQGKEGSDVFYRDGKSYVTIEENTLYTIINSASVGEHVLQLKIPKPGLRAFTFTFG